MTPDELRAQVAAGEVDTVVAAFTDPYGRNLGKRFDAEFFVTEVLAAGTHACDYLLTADVEMEPVAGYRYASWDRGYGDFHVVPDPSTLRSAGWAERTAIVVCDIVDEVGHQPVAVAPRSILRRQLERAAALGHRPLAASELEFFLYDESYRQAHDQGYADLTPAGWYIEDYHLLQGARVERYVGEVRRALRRSAIPVESSKGEWGRGQHELNIRFDDVLVMADRHTLVKQAMKELADGLGISVTFMAKPHTDQAGSSCHIHLSLWEPERRANAFDDGGRPTDLFRWFLGGWLAHVRDFAVFYAPTVNSYKRYREASWAPTGIAWAHDNRTAGFRVVGRGPSRRIECRVPGADCNPYLAYAAALASGLAGIEQRIEPPAELVGDVYAARDLPRIPASLEEANDEFRASRLAVEALGADVVEHYGHFYDVEARAFRSAVTDWERRRYFEQI